ncbi:MAG: DNA repair protein [Acutalibacteraceae bacterium]|nr:DNA repair protein [Acutalibacteraceae bacterium]
MTKKELKRLRRSDLMEILLELSKENQELREQLQQAEKKLQDRQILIEESGSLAEAALRLNRIFEDAQAACEQYEQNVRLRCEQLENETKRKCEEVMHQNDETITE